MVGRSSNNKDDKKKRRNLKQLNDRYQSRITVARQGQEASSSGDYLNAVKYYNKYLKILADIKDVEETALSPAVFDVDKELSELLLISHIYWDLCKIFDVTPHLESEFKKCLFKFVEFTHGFKYQVVNAEMLRKYIRKDRLIHKKEFREAYKRIFIASKKCYVASYVYGADHQKTEQLREFRNIYLAPSFIGQMFINYYYFLSPKVCQKIASSPKWVEKILVGLTQGILNIFISVIKFFLPKKDS